MRTFFLAAALAAIAAPAAGATRNFGIEDFQKIRVDGPFRVNLKTGVAPFATATGSPAAIDRLAIDIRGDTLVVHGNADLPGGYPGKDVGPVEVSIGTHDLSAAWLNGSGLLSIDRIKGLKFDLSVQGSGGAEVGDARVDQLTVALMGTASARLKGQGAKMTAVIRGISSLDASGLSTKDATLGAEGAATVAANVSSSATIDASGPATVRVSGGAACIVHASGSASVSGCR